MRSWGSVIGQANRGNGMRIFSVILELGGRNARAIENSPFRALACRVSSFPFLSPPPSLSPFLSLLLPLLSPSRRPSPFLVLFFLLPLSLSLVAPVASSLVSRPASRPLPFPLDSVASLPFPPSLSATRTPEKLRHQDAKPEPTLPHTTSIHKNHVSFHRLCMR